MPRTTTVESPGCPPIRALTFDSLGLIKVTEGRGKQGEVPKVVERWGEPDTSRCVLAASINDRQSDPLLALARKNCLIEVLSPVNGDLRVSIPNVSESQADTQPTDDAIVGLHLFKKQRVDFSSRSCTLLTCTTKGRAVIRSVEFPKSPGDTTSSGTPTSWDVCAAGSIFCSRVHGSENYAVFGGKGVEVNMWDLESCTKIWNAKSPAKNSLGIFTPTWFTSATFLNTDDHRKFVAGTNNHQVRLYDLSAQRRPVLSFDFRETAIKAVAEDLDGNTIYVGNGSGDLASYDIRTGKLLGCFLGKCSGSIRSIARHPNFPVIASCGLDRYLRIWDIKSRQLLSAVFLKQPLTDLVFDSHFSYEEVANAAALQPPNDPLQDLIEPAGTDEDEEEEDVLPLQRKKSSKGLGGSKKVNSKKKTKKSEVEETDDEEEDDLKWKKLSRCLDVSKRVKSKKKTKKLELVETDDEEKEDVLPLKRKKLSKGLDGSERVKSRKKTKETKRADVDVS